MLAIELPVIQVLTAVFWVLFCLIFFLNVLVCVVSHVVELQHLFERPNASVQFGFFL